MNELSFSELGASERYYWAKMRQAYAAKDILEIVGWYGTAVLDDRRLADPLMERLTRHVQEHAPETIGRCKDDGTLPPRLEASLKSAEVQRHV